MSKGAIVQDVAALHLDLSRGSQVATSAQLAGLRRLLYGWENADTETGIWFKRAAEVSFNSDLFCSTLLMLYRVWCRL